VQVTDELNLLESLLQATQRSAADHDAHGLMAILGHLERLSSSQFSHSDVVGLHARTKIALQHIQLLSEGRLAAIRGKPQVLKQLAREAAECVTKNNAWRSRAQRASSPSDDSKLLQPSD
jgi:hypothetical protein